MTGRRADQITKSGVGRTFQNIALFENLTVLENLLAGCYRYVRYDWLSALLRLPWMVKEEIAHRQKIEEIIEFLDLEQYRSYPVSVLPYGILKKVELGRALATQPKLLLLDEPAAGLNQEEREQMASYILDIREQLGITQILIEHDLGFVMDLSQEILVLNFGTIIVYGEPAQVAKHPEVIRAYMGDSVEATVA